MKFPDRMKKPECSHTHTQTHQQLRFSHRIFFFCRSLQFVLLFSSRCLASFVFGGLCVSVRVCVGGCDGGSPDKNLWHKSGTWTSCMSTQVLIDFKSNTDSVSWSCVPAAESRAHVSLNASRTHHKLISSYRQYTSSACFIYHHIWVVEITARRMCGGLPPIQKALLHLWSVTHFFAITSASRFGPFDDVNTCVGLLRAEGVVAVSLPQEWCVPPGCCFAQFWCCWPAPLSRAAVPSDSTVSRSATEISARAQ